MLSVQLSTGLTLAAPAELIFKQSFMENPFKFLFSSGGGKEKEARKPAMNKVEGAVNSRRKTFRKETYSKKDESGEIIISRRGFLKKAVLVGAGVCLGVESMNKLIDAFLEKSEKLTSSEPTDGVNKELQDLIETLKRGEESRVDRGLDEMIEIDSRPIEELVNYKIPGRIDLTSINILEVLTTYWKKRYKEDINLRTSLESAYFEMGAYDKRLKEIFKEVGVPEEYCYLAIPESHWRMTARSSAGAVGPYQFMTETAETHGLRTDAKNDERMNPIRAGWACAKELKSLYDACGDWNLVFSGYNGSKIWGYLNKSNKKNRDIPPYQDFLGYIEKKINVIRDEIKKQKYRYHVVAKGDNIGEIAKKYGKKPEEIISLNGIRDSKINIGKGLLIPYSEEEKENDFALLMKRSGYFENLNYPAKFNAVNALINEKFVTKQRAPLADRVLDLMAQPAPKPIAESIPELFSDGIKVDMRKVKKS